MKISSRRTMLSAPFAAAAPKVTYRELGRTGLKVTPLAFGCMLVGDQSVIERAYDLGINFFDTARSYSGGNNERMVGAALKGRRDKVVVSSKSLGKTKAEALADLNTSLKELGTDHLDIWYLHSKSKPEELPDELFEAQREAKKAGKIRFAGVSAHFNMQDMIPWLVKRGQTDVILASHNFTLIPAVAEAVSAGRKAGVGIVAMKVMAGGFKRIQRGDRLYGMDPKTLTQRLQQEGAMLSALKWTLKSPGVDTAIIGMTSVEELEENMRAMSEPFGEADGRRLAAQLKKIQPLYCRMCGSCSGTCPQGVPVADVLRVLAYADGYGQFPLARERYLELSAEARSVRCEDCSRCQVDCPNGVAVRDRVLRAQRMFA